MIPLCATSQRKYVISNDTIIGYTPAENRSIALIFLKGEEAEKLNFKYKEIIKYKDSIIVNNDKTIQFLDSTIIIQYENIEMLNNEIVHYKDAILEERKAKRRATWIAIGSGILNVILIGVLI